MRVRLSSQHYLPQASARQNQASSDDQHRTCLHVSRSSRSRMQCIFNVPQVCLPLSWIRVWNPVEACFSNQSFTVKLCLHKWHGLTGLLVRFCYGSLGPLFFLPFSNLKGDSSKVTHQIKVIGHGEHYSATVWRLLLLLRAMWRVRNLTLMTLQWLLCFGAEDH